MFSNSFPHDICTEIVCKSETVTEEHPTFQSRFYEKPCPSYGPSMLPTVDPSVCLSVRSDRIESVDHRAGWTDTLFFIRTKFIRTLGFKPSKI